MAGRRACRAGGWRGAGDALTDTGRAVPASGTSGLSVRVCQPVLRNPRNAQDGRAVRVQPGGFVGWVPRGAVVCGPGAVGRKGSSTRGSANGDDDNYDDGGGQGDDEGGRCGPSGGGEPEGGARDDQGGAGQGDRRPGRR